MATRFLDSFLHYNTSQILRKWTNSVNTIGAWVITPGVGRWGTAGLVYTLNSAGRVLQKTLDNQQTWVVGVAMKWNTLPGSTDAIIVVYDGGSRQVDLRVSPTGQLVATRNGTVLGTSAAALASGSFAFVEIKVVIASGAGGSFTVTVNGVAVLTLTAINTQATGNAFASTVGLGSPDGNSTGQTVTFSDLHILDGTGSVTNTLIGDCRVDCLLPASDSAIVQWNPGGSGGATHYTHVNEVPADDDTSYVQDNVVGHEDEYGMGALPGGRGGRRPPGAGPAWAVCRERGRRRGRVRPGGRVGSRQCPYP